MNHEICNGKIDMHPPFITVSQMTDLSVSVKETTRFIINNSHSDLRLFTDSITLVDWNCFTKNPISYESSLGKVCMVGGRTYICESFTTNNPYPHVFPILLSVSNIEGKTWDCVLSIIASPTHKRFCMGKLCGFEIIEKYKDDIVYVAEKNTHPVPESIYLTDHTTRLPFRETKKFNEPTNTYDVKTCFLNMRGTITKVVYNNND
jgi:hypothetical protein